MAEFLVTTPVIYAVVGLLVAGAAWSDSISVSRATLVAAAPWAVAIGGGIVAMQTNAYAGGVAATSVPVVIAAMTAVGLATWLLLAQLAALRERQYGDRYLAASGSGAATVILLALLGHVEMVPAAQAVWLAIAPIVAAVIAAVGYFLLGLIYTDPLVEFRLTGFFVIWTVVFDGVASAVAVESIQTSSYAGVTTLIVAVLASLDVVVSVWVLLPIHAILGIVLVGACGWIAYRESWVGYTMAFVPSLTALAGGTTVLLAAVLLG